MKTQHTAGLRATFTGSNNEMAFAEILTMLGRANATGIALAATDDGQRFEVRIAGGALVRLTGRDGQDRVAAAAELIEAENLSWSFRATRNAPNGEAPTTIEQLFLAVAFSRAAA